MKGEELYTIYHHSWIFRGVPDEERELLAEECKSLLQKGGWMVRNVFDFDKAQDSDFWYLIKDSFCGMEDLGEHDTRRSVRRSLERLCIQIVPRNSFSVGEAYRVMQENYEFYKVKSQCPKVESLQKRVEDLDESCDLWEAREKESHQMVAWGIARRQEHCVEYQTMKASPAFFKTHFPFYGMFYAWNAYYLGEKKMRYANAGSRSVTMHSNIQLFLEKKFAFRKAYCNIKVTYQWWLRLLVAFLYPIRKMIPSNSRVRALLNMEEMQRK